MFGIVLWCDANECKAVISCDDQGDLVHMNTNSPFETINIFQAGDALQFDVEIVGNLRYAKNVQKVDALETIDDLEINSPQVVRDDGKIIVFPNVHAAARAVEIDLERAN